MGTTPPASSDLVRKQMSQQRSRDTGPEIALRRALFARGLRYRTHMRIGRSRPDVVLTRAKIAVFVMGDFWHSCPEHGTSPKRNSEWWEAKLVSNQDRDRRQRSALEAQGWHVEWVWECEDASVAADRLTALWRIRTDRPPALQK